MRATSTTQLPKLRTQTIFPTDRNSFAHLLRKCIFLPPLQNPEINIDEKLERVSEEEIYKLQQEQTASRKELAKKRAELFAIRGLGFPDFLDIIDDT